MPNEDPIRKYSNATEEYNKAYNKVRELGTLIADIGRILNNKPLELMVSNVDVGFPPEVSMSRNVPTLDGKAWPTAKQIAESLSSLHEKRREVHHAWESLSPTDKNLVSPPADSK
jgi:hypothetical protein